MKSVEDFERLIAKFYNAKYAIAVDCCTHAIELCLRYNKPRYVTIPKHTYLSVPMTLMKLDIDFGWSDELWNDYYYLGYTNIIDGAVYWKKNGYIPNTFMCLSFQYKKHLKLGRGGMILLDDKKAYDVLCKMRYDGRDLSVASWPDQDVDMLGFHYYMTPETADNGITQFYMLRDIEPKAWSYNDYPNISEMRVFNGK